MLNQQEKGVGVGFGYIKSIIYIPRHLITKLWAGVAMNMVVRAG